MESLTAFRTFFNDPDFYDPTDIEQALKVIKPYFDFCRKGKVVYYNVPCSFDIETTSFLSNQLEKQAIMYEWTLGIYGIVFIGRTWDEFTKAMDTISKTLGLGENKRLIIYCHNLSYEFQFMRKWLDIVKVFSLEERKPIYAICSNGIEFRCSYLLSGYSLETIGKNLQTYNVRKLVGDLDYRVMRNSDTELTEEEYDYCVNDVKVVMAYIAEKIESEGNIAKLPLTKTGYVRNYCRSNQLENCSVGDKLDFIALIKSLTLTPDEYKQLKRAFQGGFTHANPFYVDKVMKDVTSYDFTSSYPYVMVSERFPMSKSQLLDGITSDDKVFRKNLKYYCCLFDVEFVGLQSKLYFDNYISFSRCLHTESATINNGRIVSADYLKTTITEQDFFIIEKFYTWKEIKIHNFRRYMKGYLPKNFVKSILELYKVKTEYKGIAGKEAEYLNSKEMLNACFGMAVTDIVRPEIVYENDEWQDDREPDLEVEIAKYNKGKGRFLFYPWGVWVTAYARRNLFTGILEFQGDYIYSDTDSIKVKNINKHSDYIKKYNDNVRQKLEQAMQYHDLPFELVEPKTKEGKPKLLGVWSFDGHYKRFKTLGAKRYLVEYSDDERNGKSAGEISMTVSGLNKGKCVPYMLEKWGDKIFQHFSNNLYIPPEYTGKLTHTYIDFPCIGEMTDFQGHTVQYYEKSAVHLCESDYTLSMAKEFSDYIMGIYDFV